jgi:hypothetical protein
MDMQLFAFLASVFRARDRILGPERSRKRFGNIVDAIYDRYNGTLPAPESAGGVTAEDVQYFRVLKGYFNSAPDPNRVGPTTVQHLWHQFSGQAPGDIGDVGFRVYLNTRPESTLRALSHVKQNCASLYIAIKVAGPRAAGRREDSIVVYVRDRAAAEQVVRVLKETAFKPTWMRGAPPRMTRQDRELWGVGIGQDPPTAARRDVPVSLGSFGQFRSKLIALALCREHGNGTAFVAEVARVFTAYGIDPDAPWACRFSHEHYDKLKAQLDRDVARAW